jgi:hypothetical protein
VRLTVSNDSDCRAEITYKRCEDGACSVSYESSFSCNADEYHSVVYTVEEKPPYSELPYYCSLYLGLGGSTSSPLYLDSRCGSKGSITVKDCNGKEATVE